MIRKATRLDIPRIMEIRAGVRENKLRDPSRVTIEDVCWFVVARFAQSEWFMAESSARTLIRPHGEEARARDASAMLLRMRLARAVRVC